MKFLIRGRLIPVKGLRSRRVDWDAGSRSKFQKSVKDFLRQFWQNHIVYEELPIPTTKLSLDFFNATLRVAIEVQGKQHIEKVDYFHKNNEAFLNQILRDQQKLEICEASNVTLVEIFSLQDLNKEHFKEYGIHL